MLKVPRKLLFLRINANWQFVVFQKEKSMFFLTHLEIRSGIRLDGINKIINKVLRLLQKK